MYLPADAPIEASRISIKRYGCGDEAPCPPPRSGVRLTVHSVSRGSSRSVPKAPKGERHLRHSLFPLNKRGVIESHQAEALVRLSGFYALDGYEELFGKLNNFWGLFFVCEGIRHCSVLRGSKQTSDNS